MVERVNEWARSAHWATLTNELSFFSPGMHLSLPHNTFASHPLQFKILHPCTALRSWSNTHISQPASRHMSANLTDVLQLISSNYCILKNYTLPIKLKLLDEFFTLMDCGVLISNIFKLEPFAGFMLTSSECDSANQSSAAQVALMIPSYVQKTFIFSAHSAAACSANCPWDTHMTHGDVRLSQCRQDTGRPTYTNTRARWHKQTHTL